MVNKFDFDEYDKEQEARANADRAAAEQEIEARHEIATNLAAGIEDYVDKNGKHCTISVQGAHVVLIATGNRTMTIEIISEIDHNCTYAGLNSLQSAQLRQPLSNFEPKDIRGEVQDWYRIISR